MGRDLTISLAKLRTRDSGRAGAKAIALGRMMRAGLPVPSGFVTTTAAFERFAKSVDPWATLESELAGLNQPDSSKIELVSRRLQDALAGQTVPSAVERAIHSALHRFPGVRLWAVRSSATAEDLPLASFAGQHESFLNVPREQVVARVRQCWLSLFSPRALLYRLRNQIPLDQAAMAVIVQEMVPAEMAGVLFTVDPASGKPNRVVIEAAPGLGEKVVAGQVTPDRLVLCRVTLAVLERSSSHSDKGIEQRAAKDAKPAVLDNAMAQGLGKLSRRVERVLGGPLDIEWAVCGGKIHLLQARPITGKLPPRRWEDRQVWSNINAGEVAPDVMTPMTWSMIQILVGFLAQSLVRLVGAAPTKVRMIGLVAGRIYSNVNAGVAGCKPFAFLTGRVPNFSQALGGGQLPLLQEGLLEVPDEDLPDLGFNWPKYVLSWPRILYDLLTHSPRRGDAWCLRLKEQNTRLAQTDLAALSTPELVQFFHGLLQQGFEGWDLLYLLTQAAALPLFQMACRRWLDDPDLNLGYRLFSALGGLPEAKAGLALWRMAVQAHADRELEEVLLGGESWPAVFAKLGETQPGRRFLAEWEAFMREHGHHCRGELELFNARWFERPDYILGLLRGYVRAMDQSNPLANQQRLAQEREQLTEQCRRRLKNPLKRWLFSRSLRRAQKLAVNREEWKNQAVRQITLLRRILLELGQRLSREGVLAQPDDVFFLEVRELEADLNAVSEGLARISRLRRDIAQRRQEYEKNLKLSPPPVVVGQYDPTSRAMPPRDANAKVLKGIPVFPGRVTGPARVILRADDHQQVLPGEILVAPSTDPAWTPYFLTAAGVIMDQGGILSHGSIVAREYGLPAVTNLGSASATIRTGDRVQVDGDRGEVTILPSTI